MSRNVYQRRIAVPIQQEYSILQVTGFAHEFGPFRVVSASEAVDRHVTSVERGCKRTQTPMQPPLLIIIFISVITVGGGIVVICPLFGFRDFGLWRGLELPEPQLGLMTGPLDRNLGIQVLKRYSRVTDFELHAPSECLVFRYRYALPKRINRLLSLKRPSFFISRFSISQIP